MSFFKNLFQKQEHTPIHSYSDFWNWFANNEKGFYKVVDSGENIEKDFFDKVFPKLEPLGNYFLLTGMYDKQTAELVFTADGNLRNFFLIEELVAAAPKIEGWRFTAFKPSMHISDMHIEMSGHTFSKENMFFYSNEDKDYPDDIDISIFHSDVTEDNKKIISNGIFVFLDNYLGEIEFSKNIDNLSVVLKEEIQKELVPIEKLKDFLIWREKEFVEKYEGIRHNTEDDGYVSLEATLNNGLPLIAVVNSTLMDWDAKPSHPWMMAVKIQYDGKDNNGFPNDEDYQQLNEIEEELMQSLKDAQGYLNLGRETAENTREIYFACKEFNKPSKITSEIIRKYAGKFEIDYEIYKDKYWRSLERFRTE